MCNTNVSEIIMIKIVPALLLLCGLLASSHVSAQEKQSFKICWSIYVGWMPWAYGAEKGIVDKWADKYGIEIEVVQINDYIESINQFTVGSFDACSMTNMDALTIPSAGGVDTTALIVGDFSNGNDGVIVKGNGGLASLKGQNVNLVELSVSHYLLARALDTVGLRESDLKVVNTSDADMVAAYSSGEITSLVTWNPMLNKIASMPGANKVFDSSQIPREIIDTLMVNTEVLEANPNFGKALVGAWYEIMSHMQPDSGKSEAARTFMGAASGTDLKGYDAQLAYTEMFYTPAKALNLLNSPSLLSTMQSVAEFSFEHGLLGEGAPDAGFIGIETPSGVFGDPSNIKLRFDPTYIQMAADGKL